MHLTHPVQPKTAGAQRPETEAGRQRLLAREAERRDPAGADRRRRLTLEGLADVESGRLIEDEAMRAWADSLGTSRELPIPQPG
jgi:hypothetical protein